MQAVISGTVYGLGDLTAQTYEGRSWREFDAARIIRSSLCGFIAHGPLSHFFYEKMDRFFIISKVRILLGMQLLCSLEVAHLVGIKDAYSAFHISVQCCVQYFRGRGCMVCTSGEDCHRPNSVCSHLELALLLHARSGSHNTVLLSVLSC